MADDSPGATSTPRARSGVEALTVSLGGRPVLRDLTLLADPGEILVVLGPSGSGKSTLLRTIAGLHTADSGSVLIRGRRVDDLPPEQRRISMVFERATLVPFLDVARNMGWGLRTRHEEDVEARVAARATRLRIRGLLRRRPNSISHGERGVVSLGRALVAEPDLFLFDEPLAALDPANRVTVRHQIVDVVSTLGVTTVYVTHDQSDAMAIGHRVAVLRQGELVQLDRPMALYERPANIVVASFIGSPAIGLVPARVVSSAGMGAFEVGRRILPLWAPLPAELAGQVGRQVVLGVRAEDVHLMEAAPDRDDLPGDARADLTVLDAMVTNVEFSGRNSVVSASIEVSSLDDAGSPVMDELSVGAGLSVAVPPQVHVRPGAPVSLALQARRAHVFDAVTGLALWHPDPRP